MSKSLGNFITIRELLDGVKSDGSIDPVDPMTIRLFVMTAQYRKPMDFSDRAIVAAGQSWQTIKDGLLFGYEFGAKLGWENLDSLPSIPNNSPEVQQFTTAVDDDFNFAEGLVVLFELAKELRKVGNIITHDGKVTSDLAKLKQQWLTLIELAGVLGLEVNPEELNITPTGLSDREIESLLIQRQTARQNKDFAGSDRIRDELKAQGITIIDRSGVPSTWHR